MPSGGGKNLLRLRSEFDDNVSGPLDKLRDKFDRLGKSKGAQSILMGVGLSVGQAAMRGVGQAMEFVTDQIGQSINASSDLREAMALSEQVFLANTDAVEEWGNTAAKSMGASKSDALNYAASFGTAFKNVGMALDDVSDRSINMAELAGDLGSAFNRSSEEAALALRSGLLGESEPMRKFGVFLSEARVKAKLLEDGIRPLNGAFTDAQKVTARYQIILEDTADSAGMFGRDTESLEDAQKELTATLENTRVKIGDELLPVMVKLSNWALTEGVPALEGLIDVVLGLSDAIGNMKGMGDEPGGFFGFTTQTQIDARKMAEHIATMTANLYDLKDVEYPTKKVTQEFADAIDEVDEAASDAAKALDDLKDAADDAYDAMIDAAFGPMELAIELKIAKEEAKLARKAFDEALGKDGKRKEGYTKLDVLELKEGLIRADKEVIVLQAELDALDGTSLAEADATIKAVAKRTNNAGDEAKRWHHWLTKVNAVSVIGTGATWTVPHGARASGGPVLPGGVYSIGESGAETLVMGASGGYVIPNGGGKGGGMTFVYSPTYSSASQAEAQAFARAILPDMTREMRRQGVI